MPRGGDFFLEHRFLLNLALWPPSGHMGTLNKRPVRKRAVWVLVGILDAD